MKTQITQARSESGSVLVVALVMAMILGISLASYLLLMNHQNKMVVRGQAWNHSLTLAEAGVEDALAHLNRSFGTNNQRGGVNGWSGGIWGPAALSDPRNLAGGSYSASISSGMPIIESTGRVAVANSSQIVERRVRAICTTEFAFRAAMAAKRGITFNGNNIMVDSYDSGLPNIYSDANGKYDFTKRKAGGDIASTEGFIKVGNADIKGKLYTGPLNDGQYSVGAQGSVGDLSWNGPGIQSGWYFNDFNMNFADVDEPYPIAPPPIGGVGGGYTNVWLLTGGKYKVDGNVKVNGPAETIYVAADSTVYVTGTFDMRGKIIVAPGASLKLYCAGLYARLNEVNTGGNAFSFQYYGLPSNQTLTWGGNDEYVGTIYAPQANLFMGGGGTLPYDYQGSCVVNSITLNGIFSFHFDENLKRRGPVSGFVVTKWEEK